MRIDVTVSDLFPDGDNTTFEIEVDTERDNEQVTFDLTDWGDFAVYVPVLGPSTSLLYVGLIMAWEQRPLNVPFVLDPTACGLNIGLAGDPCRRSWLRLVQRDLMVPSGDTFVVPRWLPELTTGELMRRTSEWRDWYRGWRSFRGSQQGVR